jgi:hypothetical protein
MNRTGYKIRHLIKRNARIVFVTAVCCAGMGCSRGDFTSVNRTVFTRPLGTSSTYRFVKQYFYFNPTGDTVFFRGAVACTVMTNGVTTSAWSDSVYIRVITQKEDSMVINNSTHLVTRQTYQQDTSAADLGSSEITRIFETTDKGVFQLAYEKGGALTFVDSAKQLVIPSPLDIGPLDPATSPNNCWRATLLIGFPFDDPAAGMKIFEGKSFAAKVMAINLADTPYIVNTTEYYDGVEIKSYYSIGSDGDNGDSAAIGDMEITDHYFNYYGLVNQFLVSSVRVHFPDGSSRVTKKTMYFARTGESPF